jgi:hypothetical protein
MWFLKDNNKKSKTNEKQMKRMGKRERQRRGMKMIEVCIFEIH